MADQLTELPPRPVATWALWVWLGLFALAFAPTAIWLWERWTISVWYNGHGIIMPVIFAYLVWDHLRDDPIQQERSSAWGFLFLGVGLSLLALDTAIHSQLLAAVGLIVCLPGISLLLLGAERTRAIAFPLVIIAFMLPIPAGFVARIYLWLRLFSASGTARIMDWLQPLLDIPVSREGTLLHLPHQIIQVADSCSGFSTLYAAVTTALILAHLARSNLRRAVLIASSVMLALVANVVRVTILTLMVHYYGIDPLDTALHELSGMLTFAVVIALLLLLAEPGSLRGTRN